MLPVSPCLRILRLSKHSLRLRGRCLASTKSPFLHISEEVKDAVQNKLPVVALETTIYTHGYPYPENIALSSRLESLIRVNGGIPATIGILNGVPKVGMQPDEIVELLEKARRPETMKLSRRDLGYICGLGLSGRPLNGGTTISGTMVLAHLAGIRIFATGGLGGVHRGGENSLDISADLTELGRTPVTVISSGCKSFLDIPRTLEYLETQGVGVATFADGRSGEVDFPAFWTRDSGVKTPKTVVDEKEAAAIVYAQMRLELTSGLHFANPIASTHSIPKDTMDSIIAEATTEADRIGKSGSDNTPFILNMIQQKTQGASKEANRALVEGNVIRGTKVAVELAALEGSLSEPSSSQDELDTDNLLFSPSHETHPSIVVAGSLAIDSSCDYRPVDEPNAKFALHTSNPADITQNLGGVGQNIATAALYAGANVHLFSIIADDVSGQRAMQWVRERGLSLDGIKIVSRGTSTAQYIAVNDKEKNLVVAMADMQILENSQDEIETFWGAKLKALRPTWLVIDANWSKASISKWVQIGLSVGAKIAFEPVSVEKSPRIFYKSTQDYIQSLMKTPEARKLSGNQWTSHQLADLATPNQYELVAMSERLTVMDAWGSFLGSIDTDLLSGHLRQLDAGRISNIENHIPLAALKLLSSVPCLLTKLGAEGVLLTEILQENDIRLLDESEADFILFRKQSRGPTDERSIILPETEPDSSLSKIGGIYMRLFSAAEHVAPEDIVSVNGVGDTFLGALITMLAKSQGRPVSDFVYAAQKAAVLTLKSKESVSPEIRNEAALSPARD